MHFHFPIFYHFFEWWVRGYFSGCYLSGEYLYGVFVLIPNGTGVLCSRARHLKEQEQGLKRIRSVFVVVIRISSAAAN